MELLSHLGSRIADQIGSAIVDAFDWFMKNVVPFIKAVLPAIAFALAVAALFTPGLGPVLLVLAGVGIGIDTAQALRGEGSWDDVARDVVGLVVGMGLGKIAKQFMAKYDNAFKIHCNSYCVEPGGGSCPARPLR